MGSLLSGTPGSTTTTVSTQTPPWMQDAIYNTVSWAQNLANKPYIPYEQPRIAGFTPTQQQGMRAAIDASGSYQPYLRGASESLQKAAGIDTAGMITGGGPSATEAARSYFEKATGMSGMGAAQPFLAQAIDPLKTAGSTAALTAAQPFFGEALGSSPLAAAKPHLTQAGKTFPGQVEQYMDPYTKNVVDRIADLGVRQLQEKFLPAIGEEFIKAGQFGGSRMGEFSARALRDVQEGVLAEQAKALQSGYGQAADIFAQDQARQAQLASTAGQLGGAQQRAMLETGQTVGQLSTSDLSRLLQSGMSIADIGRTYGALTAQDASRLAEMGSSAGALAGQEAQQQLAVQRSRADAAAADTANARAIAQQRGALAEAAQTLGLRGAGVISGVGEQEQNIAQRALDLAYQQHQEETQYPYEQLRFQAGVLSGFPSSSTGTTSTSSMIEKPTEASNLSKIIGALTGAAGIYRTLKGP